MGPVAPRHVGSSQTRARTRVPCLGRQILNHCATREAQKWHIFLTLYFSSGFVHSKNVWVTGAINFRGDATSDSHGPIRSLEDFSSPTRTVSSAPNPTGEGVSLPFGALP